ncbi:MAG: fibronectin type III domain-containing protein, partial [Gemmatimonadetes bacterium]|nr:fibronectin type III domain-containing protein [Gemmatimonadota bacterium]
MSHFYRYDIRHVCACLLWLMLTACSHDARRENLLDPDLTPPVVLQAELSHSTGAVRLTWSPYEGHQPFASYLLLRRVGSDITVDTLQTLVDRDSTAAVDTSLTPGTSYEYRVAVTNTGGLLVPSAAVTIAGFTVGAVTLLPIKVDASAGVINLQWTSFSDPGFVQYRVTRHLVGTDVDTTLFAGNDIADTTFVDTTASHGLVYSYSVATEASGQILISNADDTVLRHPPVTVLDPVFDSATASARLTWRAYSGARFYQYDVQRRTRELAYTTVGTTSDLADTTWQDTELRGATEYTYRVVVVTSRQEQVVSDEVQGGIHLLVATWDLGGLTKQPGIRLSRRPDDGRVEALLSFGDEFLRITPLVVGEPLAAVELLPNLAAEPLGFAMAAAVTDGGERIVVRNRKRDRHAATLVSAFDANERLIWRDTSLELPIPPGHQASGELALLKGFYRGLRLLSAGLEALHDDFSVLPEAEVTGTFGPWDVVNSHLALGVWAHIHQPGSMIVRDAAWSQLALQTQFTVDSAGTELRLGTDDTGHLLFFMTSP